MSYNAIVFSRLVSRFICFYHNWTVRNCFPSSRHFLIRISIPNVAKGVRVHRGIRFDQGFQFAIDRFRGSCLWFD